MPSYDVNIVSCKPEGWLFSPRAREKTISGGLTTWWLPHMKAITVLLYRNFGDVYNLNVLFCRRQHNNFWHNKYNHGSGLTKQKGIFNTILVVTGCRPNCLCIIQKGICLCCPPSNLPRQQILRLKHPNYLITFIS